MPCCTICRKRSLHDTNRQRICTADPGEFCLDDFSPIDRSTESFFEDSALAMDGSTPSSAVIPPWEKHGIAQIPYVDASTALITAVEREALPALSVARCNTIPSPVPPLDGSKPICPLSRRTTSVSQFRGTETRVKTPLTSPLMAERSAMFSSGTKKSQESQKFIDGSVPRQSTKMTDTLGLANDLPSVPDCDAFSWNTLSSISSLKASSPPASLPTPMSSCDENRGTPPTDIRQYCEHGHRRRPSMLARWKSALRDLFHHDTEDDSELEHIETPHWTE